MFRKFNDLPLIHLFFIIIFLPVLLAITIVVSINFKHSHDMFNNYNRDLNQFISDEIETIIEFQDIAFKNLDITLDKHLKEKSQLIVDKYTSGEFDLEAGNAMKLQKTIGLKNGVEDIYIINNNGVVINTTFVNDLNLNLFTFGIEHKNFLLEVFNSRDFRSDAITIEASTKRLKKYTYQSTPDGKYIIELGSYCLEAEEVLNFVEKRMDEIEEKYNNINSIGLFLKADKPFTFSKKRAPKDFNNNLLNTTFKNKKDLSLTIDTLETQLMFSFDYVERNNTSLYDEAVIAIISDLKYEQDFIKNEIIFYIILLISISIILGFILRLSFRKNITVPLKKSIKLLDKLANGEIPEIKIEEERNKHNEISKLLYSLRRLISNLRRSVNFAKEIEKGNLDAKIDITSEKDELGWSLEKMKQGLLTKQKQEKDKQKQEEVRKWHMQGLANFNNIIAQHQGNIKSLCDEITSELINYLEIQVGAIYLASDSQEELEMVSTYAYDRHKYLQQKIPFGVGLIGTTAVEQEPVALREIPDNYISIGSGIGGARPQHLIIIPITMDGRTLGVIELASFFIVDKEKIDFVTKLAENFAGAILKTKLNEEAEKLREKFEMQQITIDQLTHEKQILNEWLQKSKNKKEN